jgi:hypothetical protein
MADNSLPGEYLIKTYDKGNYVTARGGGNQLTDALIASATTPGPNEQFRLYSGLADVVFMMTSANYYVAAIDGGGVSNAPTTFETQGTTFYDTELFRFNGPSPSGTSSISTFKGNFITALDGGGRSSSAFHTDATLAQSWELFYLLKSGDLGHGYRYAIRPVGTGNIPGKGDNAIYLAALGGRTFDAMFASAGLMFNSVFTLLLQPNGNYALRTADGYFLTARNGGGLAHPTPQDGDTLQTIQITIQAWEQFTLREEAVGVYSIKTASGFYVGVSPGYQTFSTRIGSPQDAPSIGYVALFEFVPVGLNIT